MSKPNYAERVTFLPDLDVMEIDLSNLSLMQAQDADLLYDTLEALLSETGKMWYFLTNYENCVIGPAAAAQFGFRRNHINHDLSKGSVRFAPSQILEKALLGHSNDPTYDANVCENREAALERIEELKPRENE